MTDERPSVRPRFWAALATALVLPASVLAIQWAVDTLDAAAVDAARDRLGSVHWPAAYVQASDDICDSALSCFRADGDPQAVTRAILDALEDGGFTANDPVCDAADPALRCQADVAAGRARISVSTTGDRTLGSATRVSISPPYVP